MSAGAPITQVRDFLTRAARLNPAAVALVDGPRRISYAELDGLVGRLTGSLQGIGLAPLARVAIFLDKSIEMAATFLAVGAAGGIAVPINPKLKPAQLGHIISDCAPDLLVTTPFRLKQCASLAQVVGLETILVANALPDPSADHPRVRLWSTLAASPDDGSSPHRPIDRSPAAILYTSGSTGMPKGVTLSHRNLVAGAESVNGYLATRSDDVILALLPFSFDAGLSQLTTALAAGAKLVLHNYMRAQEAAELCAAEGVTSITAVPPLWLQLVETRWSDQVRQSLRLFANTGGHMPRTLLTRLRTMFPSASPFLMYGLTEAFRSTYLDPSEVDRKIDSMGKAIPNAEILVLREDGSACAPGEVGELVHRGAHVALGYWNDPERTAQRFRTFPQPAAGLAPELCVWSGDLVRRDDEGFLYFVGRRDEMIKSSGYRISPAEIEAVLFAHPQIAEAAVFGVKDEALGQRVVALVVARDGGLDERHLLAHCGQALASYMTPEIVRLAQLPRSPNGKLDRASLPSLYEAHKQQLGAA